MLTAQVDTPIGVLSLGATATGLRIVQLPRPNECEQPSIQDQPSVQDRPVQDSADPDGRVDPIAQSHLDEARQQVEEYFAGKRTEFDLPLDWTGVSGFRRTVLRLLGEVPFGETTTYGALAAGAGMPSASQAVGGIMGSNPLPIVVPCHRVLAADGLGGFGGGLRMKEWLLAWEGVMAPALDWDL
jgi:methylated-DNA-[protein]-cysteine S-methyltransferase